MKTGIVLKTDGHEAIVLKSDGSFISVNAKSSWKTGQTVPIPSVSKNRFMPFLAAAACLAIAVIGGFGWNQFYTSPVALISLDINPSIELSVNRFDRIISAKALNEEGTFLLTETNLQNTAYQEAVANLFYADGIYEYFTSDANVVLTVFASDPAVQAALLAELQGVVDSSVSHYPEPIRTEYHPVDENMVHDAHVHGVTAGKYLYLQELQELEPDLDISEYSHHSIGQIKDEIQSCQEGHHKEKRNHHNHT